MASRTIKKMVTLPLAGFANPRYLADNPLDATGFDIDGAKAVLVYFPAGSYTMTPVAEQTLDGSGLTDWFPVVARDVSDVNGAVAPLPSGANMRNKAYIFPALGTRMRFRVTALSTADAIADIGLISNTMEMPTTGQLSAGTNLIGAEAPSASATVGTGTTHAKIKSAASNNATLVKAGAGKLFRYTFRNVVATVRYAKIYNKATVPVPGTDVGATLLETIVIPPNGVATYLNPIGKAFSAGLGYAITAGVAETDNTAVAVDDVVGSIDYI